MLLRRPQVIWFFSLALTGCLTFRVALRPVFTFLIPPSSTRAALYLICLPLVTAEGGSRRRAGSSVYQHFCWYFVLDVWQFSCSFSRRFLKLGCFTNHRPAQPAWLCSGSVFGRSEVVGYGIFSSILRTKQSTQLCFENWYVYCVPKWQHKFD